MKTDGMSVADNLRLVHDKIADAAKRSGRQAQDVQLIAVSKTKPLSQIREAFQAGQKSFGENYVQEAVEKVSQFPEADWHFIGTLQSNKVKQVAGRFSLIHSVDRLKVATELSKAAQNMDCVQDVLLQIHIGDEATKHGATFTEAPELLRAMIGLPGLRVRGIMSLPPLTEDESQSRRNFASLKSHFEKWRSGVLNSDQAENFNQLSMGTSSDFEWAILEGATMVRVGSMIFGEREKL